MTKQDASNVPEVITMFEGVLEQMPNPRPGQMSNPRPGEMEAIALCAICSLPFLGCVYAHTGLHGTMLGASQRTAPQGRKRQLERKGDFIALCAAVGCRTLWGGYVCAYVSSAVAILAQVSFLTSKVRTRCL